MLVGKRAPVAQSNKRLLCTNDEQGEFEQRQKTGLPVT